MDWLHQRFSGRVDGWVIFVTVALVLWMLLDAARRGRPVADAGGSTILFRHHVLFRWIGFLMGFIAPLAIWVLPSPLREEQGDPVSKLIAMAMIAALGLPLWWEGTRFALLVSPRGLDCRSPWRKAHFLPWDQI